MRLSSCFSLVLGASFAAAAAGCSGAEDPLGGAYGGAGSLVAPNDGNTSSPGELADADTTDGGDDDAAPAPAPTGTATAHDAGKPPSTAGSSSGSSSSSGSGSSSGSSSSSGAAPSAAAVAPTWTQIYTKYLANGAVGTCGRCHNQMNTAAGSYSWLSSSRYISGTASPLAKNGSCLTWFGGNMPPGGPRSDAQAVSDMDAWAAAGAKNN
jgi:hypothetical protein